MYPKEFLWIGAKGGLVHEKHRRRMGESLWLFLWLLTRQTGINEAGEGIVLYGRPVPLRDIEGDTHFPIGTLHRWQHLLMDQDYIRVENRGQEGTVFWVMNGKDKSKRRSKSGTLSVPPLERMCSENGTQISPKNEDNLPENQEVTTETDVHNTKRTTKHPQYNTTAATKSVAVAFSELKAKVQPESLQPRRSAKELESERDRQKRDLEAWKEKTGSLP